MILKNRIEAFTSLGEILRNSLETESHRYSARILNLINTQHLKNPWFTPENVKMALKAIASVLTTDNLVKWTASYPVLNQTYNPINVGVIMAGNIPLVGFHDFLSVLISGNNLIAKTSLKDSDLIRFLGDLLCELNLEFAGKIKFTDEKLSGFDVIIATGSDNSSRYFDYYFGKYPNIIRRNRNSIAIISGNESASDLEELGTDVFTYFGLGCRNISKIYVPNGYDFSLMYESWIRYSGLLKHTKYANNYDFNKAVYIVNKEQFIDTGFLLLKESTLLSSPVAVLYFEYYNSSEKIERLSIDLKEKIQCIAGKGFIPFGKAQSPALWDYADGIDTIEFLLKNNIAGIL
jgi:hypothetical protein